MMNAPGGLIRRMALATGVLLLIVGAAFGALLYSLGEQRETARLSQHSGEVFAGADHVHRLANNMLHAQLEYTISGDARPLDRWRSAQTALPMTTARLEQIATPGPQQAQARQVTRTAESFVRDYSAPAIDAARRGDPSASSLATMHNGTSRIDQLRADLDRLRQTEADVVADRNSYINSMTDREVFAVIAGLVGSSIVIALFGGYQSRLVVRPIRRAAFMADRLARGDLGTRMPETGKDEIGDLERSFNVMAASLEHSHDELGQLVAAQTALRQVATRVARGAPPDEVLGSVAEESGRLIKTEAARIVRYEADGTGTVVAAWGEPGLGVEVGVNAPIEEESVAGRVQATGRAARLDRHEVAPGPLMTHLREHGMHSSVGAPIYIEGQLWGVVTAMTLHDVDMPPGAEYSLAEYTDLIGTAIANTQAKTDLLASRARVVRAIDQARRRIERDLHDGVQQRLISLALDVRQAELNVPEKLPKLRSQLSAVVRGLTGTVDDVRELSRGVHPAILTEGGLRPALSALARRSSVPVELGIRVATRLPEPVEVAAYYVVAEALTNAAKHAHAIVVNVGVAVEGSRLDLHVRDDGIGGADPEHGSGLLGLVDRVEALGGTITIDSPAGQGTHLHASLPIETA